MHPTQPPTDHPEGRTHLRLVRAGDCKHPTPHIPHPILSTLHTGALLCTHAWCALVHRSALHARVRSNSEELNPVLSPLATMKSKLGSCRDQLGFFFSLLLSSLELSDIKVYEPQMRARFGTASHFCEVVVLKSRIIPRCTVRVL